MFLCLYDFLKNRENMTSDWHEFSLLFALKYAIMGLRFHQGDLYHF